jgi:hypothetical protein
MNKRRAALAVTVLAAAIALSSRAPSVGPSPLVASWDATDYVYLPFIIGVGGPGEFTNPDFEYGMRDGPRIYWTGGDGAPASERTDGPFRLPPYPINPEIHPPAGWGVAWIENVGCSSSPAYPTGRPEVGIIETWQDEVRVASGEAAAKMFTFWYCHRFALFQRAHFAKGEYRFSVMGHSWYSDCDHDPYTPWPGIVDKWTGRCRELPYADDILRACVDPTGGIDPWSDDVICGEPVEQYGRYGPRIYSPWIKLSEGPATIFFISETNLPPKHNDTYFDAVEVETR